MILLEMETRREIEIGIEAGGELIEMARVVG
jgi:hypothetical protein